MGQEEILLTAYCGLYCGDCIRYRMTAAALARDLSGELANIGFDQYARITKKSVSSLGQLDGVLQFLNDLAQLQCMVACREGGDGCAGTCEVKTCAIAKGLKGCWDCEEFEACTRLDFLKPMHGEGPRINLKQIKEKGINDWARRRASCYPWNKDP